MYFIKNLFLISFLALHLNTLYAQNQNTDYNIANDIFNIDQILIESDMNIKNIHYKKIITKEDIDKSKSINLADLLSQYSNISILQSSTYAPTGLKINGSPSSNVLVLIDGVKIKDPSNPQNFYDISNIPLVFIEEIEIIEGSQVVEYGSGSAFGIINIITKKAQVNTNKTTLFFNQEIGNNFTNNSQFGLNINKNNFSVMLFGNIFYTNGYSISSEPNTTYNQYNQSLENDGSKALNITLKTSYLLSNTEYVELFYKKNYIDSNYDGSYEINNTYQTKDDSSYNIHNDNLIYIKGGINLFDTINNEIYFSHLTNSKEFYEGSTTKYDGKEENLSYLANLDKYENFTLKAGFDLSNQKMTDNQNKYTSFYHIFDSAYYVIVNEAINNDFHLEQGLRVNSRLLGGSSYTTNNYAYSMGLSYNIDSYNTIVKLNYGNGYRLPSLYEIYSIYGNSVLESEMIESINLSIKINYFSSHINSLAINIYHNNINNLIALETSYINQGNYINNGINIESSVKINESIDITPSYSFVESNNTKTNSPAPNLPKHKANINVSYKQNNWRTTLQGSYNSSAIDISTGSEQTIDGYSLFNLIFDINFNNQFNGYFKIYNIFNKDYEIYKSYNTAGRSVYLGLNYYLD